MITTHHPCNSIFPICKLQFITFPQNLHAFKKIVILVNDNLQDTNKLYKQTFSQSLPRDACHHASIRELKRKILVPMITLSTKIKATPHKNCELYATICDLVNIMHVGIGRKTPIKFLLRTKSITIKQMGIWVFLCMIVARRWQCCGCQVCISTEILHPCNCFLLQ
jgi:hypothetical protein